MRIKYFPYVYMQPIQVKYITWMNHKPDYGYFLQIYDSNELQLRSDKRISTFSISFSMKFTDDMYL